MSKRANGEGSVYQRDSDSRWVGSVSLGRTSDGKRARKTVYGKTQAEVLEKLDAIRSQAKISAKILIDKDSVADHAERWLTNVIKLNKSPKTWDDYEGTFRRYIRPYIGHIKFNKLDTDHLERWQSDLARDGHTNNTRLKAYTILRAFLNYLIKKKRLLTFNPLQAVDKPSVETAEIYSLEFEEAHRIIEAGKSHRIGDAVILAAMTGMRKGELFALEWSAINIRERVLSVRKQVVEVRGKLSEQDPKQHSRRTITLEDIAIKALERRRRKATKEGFDPAEVPLVFPNTRGGWLRSSNFDRKVWYPIREAAGISTDVNFHQLRHTQASLMLDVGVDLKVIQGRLGHKNFETTANTYAHLLKGKQAEATEQFSAKMKATKPEEIEP